MLRITHILNFIFFVNFAVAQSVQIDSNGFLESAKVMQLKKEGFQLIGRFHKPGYSSDTLLVALAMKNNKWGLINEVLKPIQPFTSPRLEFMNSNILISWQAPHNKYYRVKNGKVDTLNFSCIKPFSDGYAKAISGNKFCLIDSLANIIFYIDKRFLMPASATVATIDREVTSDEVTPSQQAVNENLLEMIGSADPLGTELFIFIKDQKFHLFHRSGKEVVLPPFQYLSKGFKKDCIKIIDEKGKYGLINYQGKLVLPIVYDFISDENGSMTPEGRDFVVITKGPLKGLANKNGEILIPCTMSNVQFTNSKKYYVAQQGLKTFLYDSSMKLIAVPKNIGQLVNVWERRQGLAYLTQSKNKLFFYNENGIRQTDSLVYAFSISDSLFMVDTGKGYQLLGTSLKPLKQESVQSIIYGGNTTQTLFAFQNKGRQELITSKGKPISSLKHDYMESISGSNLFFMKDDKLVGAVDSMDKVLIPFEYRYLECKGNLIVGSKPEGCELYTRGYQKVMGVENLRFIQVLPGNLYNCRSDTSETLLLNDKVLVKAKRLDKAGDGIFYMYGEEKAYIIDCYGNKTDMH